MDLDLERDAISNSVQEPPWLNMGLANQVHDAVAVAVLHRLLTLLFPGFHSGARFVALPFFSPRKQAANVSWPSGQAGTSLRPRSRSL